jgi:glycosyltransferase involved in cell wall biosynthesis
LDPRHSKRTTLWTAKACAWLSGLVPDRIVVNAELSRRAHAKLGYKADKMVVIPNGFDLTAFVPDPSTRLSVRRELGIPEGAPLIGSVARFHPDKDHRNLVRAAALLHAERPEARFLLCGAGLAPENRELVGWIEEAGIGDRCFLLGLRKDVARLDAALDVATSSSRSEGFPNAIGEAMACGVPCVVTDVGDSASIVGKTGVVVPPQDPEALAAAWLRVLDMDAEEHRTLGERARRRVEERYSLKRVAAAYETLYAELAVRRRRK